MNIKDYPPAKDRESQFDLDYIISMISRVPSKEILEMDKGDLWEVLLLLANEVRALKKEIDIINIHITIKPIHQ